MRDQHYMIDKELLKRIIDVASFTKKDTVLEIGPGFGALTELMVKKVKELTIIEKDEKHREYLEDHFSLPNVDIIFDDAMKVPFPEFTKCVSNLPYTLCESLLWKFLRYDFTSLVLVVPLRFTDKLVGKIESRLSLLVDTFYTVEVVEEIDPSSFDPQPKVMSSLIKITRKKRGGSFLEELFLQSDKKTKSALREVLMKRGLTKRESVAFVALKVQQSVQEKRVINLSLDEIRSIMKSFEK
jgi:16S rRNA (adenine1518-N6/adenine1519-N6)-dimethyltransferase